MTKILHFADVHLGTSNYGRADTTSGLHTRVQDFLESLDCVVEAAQVYTPDLILFAGDAFKTRTPNPTLVTHFSERIQQLADIAPVIMVVGNHDAQRTGADRRHSIDVMGQLRADNPIDVYDYIVGVEYDSAYVVTLPWLYDTPLEQVCAALDKELDAGPETKPYILLGHCGVEGAIFDSGMRVSLGDDLVYPIELFCDASCWDYVALGHIHKHQFLCKNPPVVYCGSIDRVNWGEREYAKGFVLAEIGTEKTSWRFVDIAPRDMIDVQVHYDHLASLVQQDVTDAIVRVGVTSDKVVMEAAVRDEVLEYLPSDYHVLDMVTVSYPKEDRWRHSDVVLEAKTTLELLEMYWEDKYPTDPDWIDMLYDAAIELMEMEDSE